MPVTKNRLIRFITLDKCLRNTGRSYYLRDLVEECCQALERENPKSTGISKRSVQEDIKFMKSPEGYSAPIDSKADNSDEHRRPTYFYTDNKFSITNQPMTESDLMQVRETYSFLNKFNGLPQMNWMGESIKCLVDSFKFDENAQVMGFDENPDLCGINRMNGLFNAIVYKKVLDIEWTSFTKGKCEAEISPYYLKQYNNRWFLFALSHSVDKIINIPLDRIVTFDVTSKEYHTTDIKFYEYFDDVVGVSIPYDAKCEKVTLKVSKGLFPYIESKPIHCSQKLRKQENGDGDLELDIIINYEFKALLRSLGMGITVVSPESLRKDMLANLTTMCNNYSL